MSQHICIRKCLCSSPRLQILIDHKNNDFTLWESGAIIQYLVEKYDKEGKLSAQGDDKHLVAQWLAFQISGQGPYFGEEPSQALENCV